MNKFNDPISYEQPEDLSPQDAAMATTLFTPRVKIFVALRL